MQDLNKQQATLQRNLLETSRDIEEDNIHADVSFKSTEIVSAQTRQTSANDSKWRSFLPEDEIQNVTTDANGKFNDPSDLKINLQEIELKHDEGVTYISASERAKCHPRNNENCEDLNNIYTFEKPKKFKRERVKVAHAHDSKTEEHERLMLNEVKLTQKSNVFKKHETSYVSVDFETKFGEDGKCNYNTASAPRSRNAFQMDDNKRDCHANKAQVDSRASDTTVSKTSKWFQYISETETDTESNKTETSVLKTDMCTSTHSYRPSLDDIKTASTIEIVDEAPSALVENRVVNIFKCDDSELDFTLEF